MHPDLERTRQAILDVSDGLTPEQLSWHPEGKWSTSEILEHLQKTYASTAHILDRCVEQGVSKASDATLRQRAGAWVVVDLGYFPTGQPAPEMVLPTGMPADQVVAAAVASLLRFDEVGARAEARFGTDVKVANHPILGAFNLRQWRRFHLIHTRHHAKQIVRLRALMPA